MAAMALAQSSGPRKKAQGSECQHQNSVLLDMLPSAALTNLGVEEGWQLPPGTPGCFLAQGREPESQARPGPGLSWWVGWSFRDRLQASNLLAPSSGSPPQPAPLTSLSPSAGWGTGLKPRKVLLSPACAPASLVPTSFILKRNNKRSYFGTQFFLFTKEK